MAQTKIKAGLFEGIIGNGTDGYFLMSNGDGTMTWSSVVINPTITDVDYPGTATAADPAGGETITLTGTGFKTGVAVTIGGTSAPAVSYVSETQITFTTPAKTAGDYDIVVTNTDTGSATFINGISFNGIPAWTTAAGSLGTFASNTTISTITLQATEPDAGTITFNITNGALPTGLSLTGANIDGTTSILNADTLYTFTVTATDDENQATPRTFTITVQKEFISSENFTINTYTGNGSTQSIEGKIGTAAEFNGSSSKFNTGIVLDSTTFSVSLWFKTSVTGKTIIGNFNSSASSTTDRDGFIIQPDKYIFNNNDVEIFRSNYNAGDLADGSWHHIIVTNDGSNSKVYIDGSLDRTDNSSGWNTLGTQDIHLGFTQRNPIVNWYDGLIDQVRIFNKALSSSEVTTLYGESNTSTTKSTTDIFADGSGVALYEFEKGAIDTGGTNGYIGSAGVFNGSSSYIEVPSFSFGSDNIAVSMWVNPESTQTAYSNLFDFDHSSGTVGTFSIQQDNTNTNQYKINQWNGSSYNVSTAVTLSANQWNHLVFSLQSNGSYVIYLNGSSSVTGSNLTASTSAATETLNIGRWLSTGTPGRYFNGKLDQIRIFNKALSSSEVTTLYGETSASATKSTTDIFDDGSGIALYELEGNANDTGGVSGKFGSAAIFNGSSSYITLGATNQFASGTVSISFWVNPATISTNYVLLGNGNGGSFAEGDNDIFLRSDGYIGYELGQSSSIYEAKYSTTTQLTANTWNHITLTYDSSLGTNITQVYVNGVQQSLSATYAAGGTFSGDIFIGTLDYHIGKRNLSTLFFDGKIDDVRIYSDVLTSTEVGYLYNNTTASIPTDNLVAYYKLDGNSTDEQGNYNGTDTDISYGYDGTATNVSYAYDGTPTNVGFVGTSFQPDLVWVKSRGYAEQHGLFDSVRGANLWLHSETTQAQTNYSGNYGVLSFDSNGFSIGNGTAINRSGDNHVAWCWKAASSDSTNTDGSITSTVRANQDAGFSVVKYTGNGTAGATIGHGLSSTPEMVIVKAISGTDAGSTSWHVYTPTTGATKTIMLNSSAAASTNSLIWNNTAPTSTVFSVSNNTETNGTSSQQYITYCFHSVSGYQKIGSFSYSVGYSENVGFEPRFLLMKKTSSTGSWYMIDNKRVSGSNNYGILANSAAAEDTGTDYITFTSTGFTTTYSDSGTYIYLAIA